MHKVFRIFVMLMVFCTSTVYGKTLLVLGDSLSAAYGIEQRQGWVALMTNRLAEQGSTLQVVNASISGETTSGGVSRLPKLLDRHQPAYIVLELAANDGLRGTPLKVIENNLRQLIEMGQQAGAKILLVGIQLPPNYGPRYTRNFFAIFEKLQAEYQTYRVPFLMDKVALEPNLMQSDRLHPNAEAQPILLDNVWPGLSEMLAD
ncbi:MAG: arylesterase [Pseudomonadales bacterium]